MTVKRIRPSQVEDVLHLMVSLRDELRHPADPRQVLRQFQDLMRRRDGGLHVLVLREGRFPIGYAAGYLGIGSTLQVVFGVVEVYVSKPYRGGKALRFLQHEVARYARAKGAVALELRLRRTQRDWILLADWLGFDPTSREIWEQRIP